MTFRRSEPPYEDTGVAPSRTWAQVQELLAGYGAEAVRITQTMGGVTTVEFILATSTGGVERRFVCSVTSPVIVRERRRLIKDSGGYSHRETVHEKDPAAEARMTYWYIKSLLEAASFGMMSVERVFMTHIKFALPDGSTVTAGEVMERAIGEGKAPTVQGFDQMRPALPGAGVEGGPIVVPQGDRGRQT